MKALDVADIVLDYCASIGKPISHLQLHKVLYFLQIFYYINKKEFLIDEDFEAWPYGPVIRKVYFKYAIYGGNNIIISRQSNDNMESFPKDYEIPIHNFIKQLIDKKPYELVQISHKKESPWYKVYNNGEGDGEIINKELLKEYANARKQY